ncbi:MAG: beta-ketoacyl-ACP synthase 3 [Planctomycetota bacterium]
MTQPQPPVPTSTDPAAASLAAPAPVDPVAAARRLYRWMRTSETVDRVVVELSSSGEAFFSITSRGHEGIAALGMALRPHDWVFGHYRDLPLYLTRGLGPRVWFDALLGNVRSVSSGRQMSCFVASATARVASTPVPVANHCTHALGVADRIKDDSEKPVVVCGLGDGGTQQGEFYEGVAEAVRENLPVLFYVEDNGLAISTRTAGRTFYDLPSGPADALFGLPIHRLDLRRVWSAAEPLAQVVEGMRASRGPALAVLRVERMRAHSNADDHRVYRDAEHLAHLAAEGDPVERLKHDLLAEGLLDDAEVERIDAEVEAEVRAAAESARRAPEPTLAPALEVARPIPESIGPAAPDPSARPATQAADNGQARLTMLEAMRATFRDALETDADVTLLGQDIEDPKGDVFGVTKGLSTDFPGRVRNAPLSESIILGKSIGQAMLGGRPVAMVQFADFLPNGVSQILSELSTMYWRTGGVLECPVIVTAPCGGYRPGLGPFHAQTFEGTLAHIPGIDVLMPSTAEDAAGLLRAAFASRRPTVLLYPKVCLNDRSDDLTAAPERLGQPIPLGRARRLMPGDDLTMVSWGAAMGPTRDAARWLNEHAGVSIDLWDLRSITPWDRPAIVASAKRTGRLIVAHEDVSTGGFGAEILAAVSEDAPGVRTGRVARPDTHIPYSYASQVEILPSVRRLVDAAGRLLDLTFELTPDAVPAPAAPSSEASAAGTGEEIVIEAPAPSPADQAVTLLEWRVAKGDRVDAGAPLAEIEADKAAAEVSAPAAGVVSELLVAEGEQVDVGTPIVRLLADPVEAGIDRVVARTNREAPLPYASAARTTSPAADAEHTDAAREAVQVVLSPIWIAEGADRLTNAQLVERFPQWTSEDIVRRTGIESRPVCGPDQSALSLAVEAAEKVLKAEGLSVHDLSGIVCHTTTPPANTPSMACLLLAALDPKSEVECMVYDVNAACSGWLYAIDAAFHTVRSRPDSKVLVVTTEALSRVVDHDDFDTVILFGDAATATLVRGGVGSAPRPVCQDAPAMLLHQPVLSGKADPKGILTVGFEGGDPVKMDGKRVFSEAVRAMTNMSSRAFAASGLPLDTLDWLVPHQANRRIFEAVRQRLKVPQEKVIDLIAEHGNTSSSSIPLSIAKEAHRMSPGQSIGVCAFGGGFTFGAAVIELI